MKDEKLEKKQSVDLVEGKLEVKEKVEASERSKAELKKVDPPLSIAKQKIEENVVVPKRLRHIHKIH